MGHPICKLRKQKRERLKRPWISLLAIVVLLGTGITACDDDPVSDDTDEPPASITAEIEVNPEEPQLGATVEVDASGSDLTGVADPEFEWTLSAPDGSSAELADPTSPSTSFDTDEAGEYEVSVEVSGSGATDAALTTIEVLAVQEISSNINSQTEWVADVLYIVTDDIDVNDQLTIEAGTRIEFEAGNEMRVTEDGIMIADGTEQDSIRFTGTDTTPGHWTGLQFNTTQSQSNLLNYVIVEYAGGLGFWQTQDIYANLLVGSRTSGTSANVQVTNSTFRHSAGVGMKVTHDSELMNSSNNTYTENSLGAVHIDAKRVHNLSGSSDFTENDEDVVWVDVGSSLEGEDRVWETINVPYVINDQVEVRDIDFTIESGGEYHFELAASIEYSGDGEFVIEGPEAGENNGESEMTLFTGTDQEPGWWRGIQVGSATNPNNSITGAIIEYAGQSDGFWGTQSNLANLVIGTRTNRGAVSVNNTILRNGAGYGLRMTDTDSEMRNSGNNTFTGNSEGAAYIYANNIHYLDSESDYTGNNGNDFVFVEDSDVEGSSVTWNPLNVPYRMDSETDLVDDSELTILAGSEFEFTSGSALRAVNESVLVVEGSETDPVVFSGVDKAPGSWIGVLIASTRAGNSIDYAVFEYGAGDGFWNTQDEDAMLVIGGRTNEGQATVTNSDFINSGGYGIYVRDFSTANDDICDVNSFSDNQAGDCLEE